MVNMGQFLNEYAQDVHVLVPVALAALAVLAVFSLLFNQWVGGLGVKKDGYTALLVAIGVTITLILVAVISWKASILVVLAFVASGSMMIIGDVRRTINQREAEVAEAKHPRRKALPYVAAGLIDEAIMLLAQVERGMKAHLEGKSDDRKAGLMALAVKESVSKLQEARRVEG